MPQLCQAFFQVDPGARDGVGMGLALVAWSKPMVESWRWIRPSEGSEFSLTFSPMMAMPCVETDYRAFALHFEPALKPPHEQAPLRRFFFACAPHPFFICIAGNDASWE